MGLGPLNHLVFGAIATLLLGASEPTVIAERTRTLDPAWSVRGEWRGVVTDDNTGAIYALAPNGKAVEVDSNGKVVREFELPGASGSILRFARFKAGGDGVLLEFRVWASELGAYDSNGRALWTYPHGRADGVDDIWAADLDGDGSDETIVGFNGAGGLHVLDKKGRLLWKSSSITDVWHVHAGDVSGDGHLQLVASSGVDRTVHVFGRQGEQLPDIEAGCHVHMVRVIPGSIQAGSPVVVVSCDPGGRGQVLRAISSDGTPKWSTDLPGDAEPTVVSMAVAPDRKFLAVGIQGGIVHVVDVATGAIVVSVKDQGTSPEIAWATVTGDRSPLLLVASGLALNAFRMPR